MKTEKSTLKERMESEGFGEISFQEGIEKPEYSEEYVEEVEKSEKDQLKERIESEGFGNFKEHADMFVDYLEEYIEEVEKSEKDQLKGGLADRETITSIAKKHKVDVVKIKRQLKWGMEIEMEHTDNPFIAVEIALDHLVESPIYYTELYNMENKLKKG